MRSRGIGYGDAYVNNFSQSGLNPERIQIIPFNFTLTTLGETQNSVYTLSTGLDFTMVMVNSYASGALGFTYNIKDLVTSEQLFINEIKDTVGTGNGQHPFYMPRVHKFSAGNTIEIDVTNKVNGANTVQVALIGFKSSSSASSGNQANMSGYGDQVAADRYLIDRLFAIPFNFSMVGSSYQSKYPISAAYDFMWNMLNSSSPTRDFLLQIKDEYVNEDFFADTVYGGSITGNGQNPFILPRPYVFRGGTYLTVTITDTVSAGPPAAATVQVVFIGYKVKLVKGA